MSMAVDRRGGTANVGENEVVGGQGGAYDSNPNDLAGSCMDKGVWVEVDGTEIPTTNVETFITKDGPPFLSRLTSVEFPMEWKNQSVTQYISGYDESSEGGFQTCKIYYSDGGEETMTARHLVHHGFVGAVGGTDRVGVGKFWVYDAYEFMGGLPASVEFTNATVDEILNYVAFDEDAGLGPNSPFVVTTQTGSIGSSDLRTKEHGWEMLPSIGPSVHVEHKTFEKNKHTLLDVIEWVSKNTGAEWYFDPTESGVTLTLDTSPGGQRLVQHGFGSSDYGDMNIRIIKNTAIHEIQPYNAMTVYGETGHALSGWNPFTPPSDEFPYATATYPPLVQRAGGEHMPEIQNSDVTTPESAEGEAIKKLKEYITNAGDGNIQAKCKPMCLPGDTIIARPTCSEHFEMDVHALEWEVQEVRHFKEAGSSGISKIYVSMYVNPDLINVESGLMKA